jgi:hypothetical protein
VPNISPLALLFSHICVSFCILVFCKLLSKKCDSNVEDAKKLKKGISEARIER